MQATLTRELTQREKEVLDHIASFYTYPQICGKLGISYKTLNRHISNLMEKTGLHRKELLIKYALENGYGLKEAI